MAVFEESKQHTERAIVIKLLTILTDNPDTTQRNLATEIGISLGMIVSYMKSGIRKGFIRSKQVAPKRWAYFITPEGLKEKSFMVKDYLARSITFFRQARAQCEEAFDLCKANSWTRVALIGEGDLADIARLVAQSAGLMVEAAAIDADLTKYDAVLVTDILNPQMTYDVIKLKIAHDRLLTLKLLHISILKAIS